MPRKPNADDARLILQLYDLRREPEMRKARQWWTTTFWPQTAEDFVKVATAVGTQENNWLRQVVSYWGIAASLVLHGTLHAKPFLEMPFSGEMYVMFAKVRPFLKELREKKQNPMDFRIVEKVILGSKEGRARLAAVEGRLALRR
jgi:hypothetical protein